MASEGANLVLDLRYVRRLCSLARADELCQEPSLPGLAYQLIAADAVLTRMIIQEERKLADGNQTQYISRPVNAES